MMVEISQPPPLQKEDHVPRRDDGIEAELDPSDLGKKDPGEDPASDRIFFRKVELDLEGIRVAEGVVFSLALEPGEAFRVLSIQGLPDRPVEAPSLGTRSTDRPIRSRRFASDGSCRVEGEPQTSARIPG